MHDNVVSLRLDGSDITASPNSRPNPTSDSPRLEEWLKTLSLDNLLRLLDDLDAEDREFLMEGVRTNVRLAEYGLKHGPAPASARLWIVWSAKSSSAGT